jgi:hypothetical protein
MQLGQILAGRTKSSYDEVDIGQQHVGARSLIVRRAWPAVLASAVVACSATAPGAERTSSQSVALGSTPSYVQSTSSTPQSPVASLTLSYGDAQTAGDLNVVVVGWNDATSSITSLADSSGNVYQVAVPTIRGPEISQAIYYAPNIHGEASNTVTVKFNADAAFVDLRIVEYAGVANPVALTGADSGSGSTATASLSSLTVASAPALIFAAGTTFGEFSGAGSGFTSREITTPDGDIVEDRIVSASGSYPVSAVQFSAATWVMQAVAFSSATDGGAKDAGAKSDSGSGTDSGTKADSKPPPVDAAPGVPALVQHESSSSTRDNSMASPYCFTYQLPDATTKGNAVIVGFTYGSTNASPSVSDDQGNAYTIEEAFYDAADHQSVGIAAAFDVVGGARIITLCFASDPGEYVEPMATEFDNVVGIDGPGTGASGSGASVSAGKVTPTANGDLAYQIAVSVSPARDPGGFTQNGFTAGTEGTTWSLLSADVRDGWAAQYGVIASTAAVTPTMTLGTSDHWVTGAILLKTGKAGSVPGGMRIVHLVHENLPETEASGGTGNPFPNPTALQLPSSGNLVVAVIGGGNAPVYVDNVTDSKDNGWALAGQTYSESDDSIYVQTFYAANAAPANDLSLSVSWNASDGDFTIFFYDIVGAATSPLDKTVGGGGNQTSAGPLTLPFTLTPATSAELVFVETMWAYNTGIGLVDGLFDTNTFSGESESGPEPVDQNNGWGHYIATSTRPITFTWDEMYPGLNVGPWAGMAVAFKAGPDGIDNPPPPTGPTVLQSNAADPQSSEQSVSAQFSLAELSGDMNVVVVGWNDATSDLSTTNPVVDSAGNVYHLATGPTRGTSTSQSIYVASGIVASASNAVTVNFASVVPYVDLRIVEVSGVSAVDQAASASGSTDLATTANLKTTVGPEMIIAGGTTTGSFVGAASGYTLQQLTIPDSDIVESRLVATAGSYPVSAGLNGAADWVFQAVSLR